MDKLVLGKFFFTIRIKYSKHQGAKPKMCFSLLSFNLLNVFTILKNENKERKRKRKRKICETDRVNVFVPRCQMSLEFYLFQSMCSDDVLMDLIEHGPSGFPQSCGVYSDLSQCCH